MSNPTPYTADELAHARRALSANSPWTIARRALATVDAERARRLTAEDGWLTEVTELLAQRDALRAAVRRLAKCADRGGPSNWRDFLDDPAEADAIRRALCRHQDDDHSLSGDTCDACGGRALDASPTEGNPE